MYFHTSCSLPGLISNILHYLNKLPSLGFGEIWLCHPKEFLSNCNWLVKIYIQIFKSLKHNGPVTADSSDTFLKKFDRIIKLESLGSWMKYICMYTYKTLALSGKKTSLMNLELLKPKWERECWYI